MSFVKTFKLTLWKWLTCTSSRINRLTSDTNPSFSNSMLFYKDGPHYNCRSHLLCIASAVGWSDSHRHSSSERENWRPQLDSIFARPIMVRFKNTYQWKFFLRNETKTFSTLHVFPICSEVGLVIIENIWIRIRILDLSAKNYGSTSSGFLSTSIR